MTESLDALLEGEAHATFHDAVVRAIHVDYTSSRFVAEIEVCVGDPDAADEPSRERRRRGRLVVDGLKFWSVEPPADVNVSARQGLWLTSYGALSQSPTEVGRVLAREIEASDVNWFVYFSDMNAFGYLAGKKVSFTWL
jgi:hypothetical protein